MKRIEISISKISTLIVIAFLTGFLLSCNSGNSKKNEEHEHMESEEGHQHDEGGHEHEMSEDDHDEAGEHHHDEAALTENASGEYVWMPGETPFGGSLKLEKGDTQKLNAEITSTAQGESVLSLQASGEEAIMLLDGKSFASIGAELQFNAEGFEGTLAILHHYQDNSNYDMVSLSNQSMELARVENGKMKAFDEKDVSIHSGWATLKLSSAGEHYKGYLDDKQLTHGHGEEKPAGKVGIMLKGTGKVTLKSLTIIPLTE